MLAAYKGMLIIAPLFLFFQRTMSTSRSQHLLVKLGGRAVVVGRYGIVESATTVAQGQSIGTSLYKARWCLSVWEKAIEQACRTHHERDSHRRRGVMLGRAMNIRVSQSVFVEEHSEKLQVGRLHVTSVLTLPSLTTASFKSELKN